MGLQGTKRVVNHRFIHIALQFFGLTLRDKSPLTGETGMCNSSLCREIKTTSDKIDGFIIFILGLFKDNTASVPT